MLPYEVLKKSQAYVTFLQHSMKLKSGADSRGGLLTWDKIFPILSSFSLFTHPH